MTSPASSAVAFNSTIAGIESADVVLLVGSNIRWEAPLIATRVRKVARKGGKVFAIGPEVDLGMKVEWLGDDLELLGKLPEGGDGRVREGRAAGGDRRTGRVGSRRPRRCAGARSAARPDQGLDAQDRLERLQRPPHLRFAHGVADPRLRPDRRNRRHRSREARAGAAARRRRDAPRPLRGRVQGLYRPPRRQWRAGRPTWSCPARPMPRSTAPTSTPRAACSAARRRRSRRARRARTGRSCARFRSLPARRLPFDSFDQLRAAMVADYPQLGRDGLIDLPWSPPKLAAKAEGPVRYPIADFFLTNAICRNSPTMQRCSEELVQGSIRGGGGVRRGAQSLSRCGEGTARRERGEGCARRSHPPPLTRRPLPLPQRRGA